MAAILKRKKAYEVALGITPKPSEPSTTAIWEDKDAIAQELITTTICDEQVIHVSTCTVAQTTVPMFACFSLKSITPNRI